MVDSTSKGRHDDDNDDHDSDGRYTIDKDIAILKRSRAEEGTWKRCKRKSTS